MRRATDPAHRHTGSTTNDSHGEDRGPADQFAVASLANRSRSSEKFGAFLTGGTPSTRPQRRLGYESMRAADVRRSMSIPLALPSWSQAESAQTGLPVRGRPPTVASAPTLRVPSGKKKQLQRSLRATDVTWPSLFSDPEGLRLYGERVRVPPSFPAI